jgi:Flp pilus assembly protein CpaB
MRVIYLIAAVVLSALLALFLAQGGGESGVTVQQQAFNTQELVEKFKGTEIYTIKGKVYAGQVLSEALVEIKEWPKNGTLPDHIRKGELSSFIGAVFPTPQAAGTPLLKSNLVTVQNRSTYFSALIRKGMKAISLNIKDSDGYVLGSLEPGDYVDIILNHRVNVDIKKDRQELVDVVETLFKNVRVLAIDGQFVFAANPETAPPGPPQTKIARSVTLEVTEKIAEILSVASKTGDISVVANPLQLALYSNYSPEEIEKKSSAAPYFIESAFDGDFKSETNTTDVSPFIAKFKPDLSTTLATGKPVKNEEDKKLFIFQGAPGGGRQNNKDLSTPEVPGEDASSAPASVNP